MDNIIQISVFLPLLAFLITGIFANSMKPGWSMLINSSFVSIAAILSIIILYDVSFLGNTYHIELFRWIEIGKLSIHWSIYIDTVSVFMLAVVNVISALIQIYSIGYMEFDRKLNRFAAYLSLFTFFMLILVTSNNIIQLFFGWEGVGLCSYLLIGFYNYKESANNAAFKAILLNRFADLFFLIGILSLYIVFDTFEFNDIFAKVSKYESFGFNFAGFNIGALDFITMFLFIGCMGKSAQIIFHVWLPDAMEGPTPASALIHAATMVTAGVFFVILDSH